MRLFSLNPKRFFRSCGLLPFADNDSSGDADTEPEEEEEDLGLFLGDGIPNPEQFSEDRRTLPRGDMEEAALPENAKDGVPTGGMFMAPDKERDYIPPQESKPKEQPVPKKTVDVDLGETSAFAVPEVGEDGVHGVDRPKKLFALDYLLAALFALLGFVLVVSTYRGFGMSWDEAYYYGPAKKTLEWGAKAVSGDQTAMSAKEIDAAFAGEKNIQELPMAPKLIFASGIWLGKALGIDAQYIAMRIPIAVCYGLSLMIIYLLAGKYYARTGAILSVLCYMTIPRIFGHAHLAGTETILILMSLAMTYCFVQGLDRWPWAVLTGIVFGLGLATKFNAVFFPFALLIWAHLFQRRFYANNIFAIIFLAPVVMFLVWPWLWPDPSYRILNYLAFFTTHKSIPVHYFGQTFPFIGPDGFVPTPWSYPLIMTAFTTPVLILLLALLGLARTMANLKRHDIGMLYLLQFAAPITISALPFAPKYDGVRLFLPAFPYLALRAGGGAAGVAAQIRGFGLARQRQGAAQFFVTILAVAIIGNGVIIISRYHPHELSYWNAMAGGLQGARRAQMETTYWGEAVSEEVHAYLNELPDGARVRPLSLHPEGLKHLQEMGVLNKGLVIDTTPPGDVILLQARQGFFGPEETVLFEERDTHGDVLVQFQNIPFVIAYDLRNNPELLEKLKKIWLQGRE